MGKKASLNTIRILLCLMLATGWMVAAPASGDSPVTVPERVGTLSRFPKDIAKKYRFTDFRNQVYSQAPQGSIISNPDLGVLYQIWTVSGAHPTLADKSIIAERSLATLELRRTVVVPKAIMGSNGPTGIEFVHTLDERNQRLILEYGHYAIQNPDPFGIVILDLRTFALYMKAFPAGLVRNLEKSQAVFGLEYDEEGDRLIILAAGVDNNPSTTANTVSLIGWDNAHLVVEGPLPGAPLMLGPRLVRNCRRDPINTVSTPRLTPIMIAKGPDLDSPEEDPPVKRWVVFPCFTTPFSVNDVLVRISSENLFDPTAREEKALPAPASIAHWAMDVKRGRMFLLNATQEVDAWVYEVASNAFIGLIEMSPKGDTSAASVALGVDERSGRLYGVSPMGLGLMISEADQDPVPQADTYDVGGPLLASQATIAIDPARDRIIFVRGAGGPLSWVDDYEVWKVPPPLPDQKPFDRDTLTTQVDEKEGRTTAEYGGVASGYGMRILMAGGLAGVPPSNGNDSVGAFYATANVKCSQRSREIALGVVAETELSQSIVDARAESVRLDDNTVKDFGQPSRCEPYYQYAGPVPQIFPQILRDNLFFTSTFGKTDQVRDHAGVSQAMRALGIDKAVAELTGVDATGKSEDEFNKRTAPHTTWQYDAANCVADWYPNDRPGKSSERFTGETRVDCRTPRSVSAQAEGHATAVLGPSGAAIPIKAGRATSETKVYLDPKRGLVAEATSRAENIRIGTISIGFIENTARSFAKGRRGTAGTDEYRPVIGLVRGGGITGCELRCNIDQFLPQLNNALAGRAEVRRINPDLRLKEGTDGGYEGGIIKSGKQRASDNALTGDDSREVPALELVIYNDNPSLGRARQLVQFAGVRATSNYGIKLIAEGTPCPDCDQPPPPPPPEVGGVQVVTVVQEVPGQTIIKRVPVVIGVPGGYRLLLANPRAAGGMMTVWLLLLSPALAYARRRRLKTLG
ncbi:MAG TPA: hypothetical protein VM841_05835 [Actinomycetota bacterium]|nr:hypothetical protein [Actinomycetota bacterium]